ncbi:MAG: hypothetical protein ACLVAW_14985 [Eisenbergiella massiliensis]
MSWNTTAYGDCHIPADNSVLGWLVSYMTGYMLRKRSGELSIYGFRAV